MQAGAPDSARAPLPATLRTGAGGSVQVTRHTETAQRLAAATVVKSTERQLRAAPSRAIVFII